MGQRVIIDANNNVRIIETGPIGPTGLGGGDKETVVVSTFLDQEIEIPEGYTIEDVLTLANPTPLGALAAVIGFGALDGIYEGQSGSSDDPSTYQPLTRRSGLPNGAIISDERSKSFSELPEAGPWLIIKDQVVGGWKAPVKIGGGSSGAYLLDLRDGVGEIPEFPSGSGPFFVLPSSMFSNAYAPQIIGVDFSQLPDDKDTLVVLLSEGFWMMLPTGWPDESRGSWTLQVVFEDYDPDNNLVMMGIAMEDLMSWGFFPTNANVTVEYHTGWGG